MTTSTQTATAGSTAATAFPRTPAADLLFGIGVVALALMAMPSLLGALVMSGYVGFASGGVLGVLIALPLLAALVISPTVVFVAGARRATTAGRIGAWLVCCAAAAALPLGFSLSII